MQIQQPPLDIRAIVIDEILEAFGDNKRVFLRTIFMQKISSVMVKECCQWYEWIRAISPSVGPCIINPARGTTGMIDRVLEAM